MARIGNRVLLSTIITISHEAHDTITTPSTRPFIELDLFHRSNRPNSNGKQDVFDGEQSFSQLLVLHAQNSLPGHDGSLDHHVYRCQHSGKLFRATSWIHRHNTFRTAWTSCLQVQTPRESWYSASMMAITDSRLAIPHRWLRCSSLSF